ncbi:MAG: carbohydrate kinase [Candidatus Eisenbacteria bacterium]|nr:carbohydrate kinase [Candidatus Eisenbacteria bacterium]
MTREDPILDILGLGVSALDLLLLVEEFPSGEGVAPALETSVQGGGPVAGALTAAARLGARTAMIDRIGDDRRGVSILEEFRRAGVDASLIRVEPGRESAVASILVRRRDGARSIVFAPGTGPEMDAGDAPLERIASARFLHVNGRHLGACAAACRHAREKGVTVSFDGGAHRYRPELDPILRLTDILITAREFAERFTGESDPERAAAALIDAGASIAGVTDGARGSTFRERSGDRFHQAAFPADPLVDTTGCGDAFHGAFLFGLSRDWETRRAARLAAAVAARVATRLGGRAGQPTFEEAKRFAGGL